jgi:hypothetical protein
MGTTPATSDALIGSGIVPVKSIPIGPRPADNELTLTTTGVADRTRSPLVPATVIHEPPVGASRAALTVIVDVPVPVSEEGENVTVVPAG